MKLDQRLNLFWIDTCAGKHGFDLRASEQDEDGLSLEFRRLHWAVVDSIDALFGVGIVIRQEPTEEISITLCDPFVLEWRIANRVLTVFTEETNLDELVLRLLRLHSERNPLAYRDMKEVEGPVPYEECEHQRAKRYFQKKYTVPCTCRFEL